MEIISDLFCNYDIPISCINLNFLLNGTFIQCCFITQMDVILNPCKTYFVLIGHIEIKVTMAL